MWKERSRGPQHLGVGAPAGSSGPQVRRVVIESMAAGGRGVGRVGGKVWLVEGGLAGDTVIAAPRKERRAYVEGVASRIEAPSKDRRDPACPIQGKCGGCPWMPLREDAQRGWKRRIVSDCLRRIGGFREPEVSEALSGGPATGYRNRIEVVFGRSGGRRALGYHARGEPGGLVDVERCILADDAANALLATAREYFLDGPGRGDAALEGEHGAVRLILRRSASALRSLVVLRDAGGPFPSAPGFARAVAERHADVAGVVRVSGPPGRRGGAGATVLAGEGWIEETLGGLAFRVPADSFFQVNPAAAEHLVRLVLEAAGESGGEALDLYAGVGVFALALARSGWRVTAVEANGEAVGGGRLAAAALGLDRAVEFVAAGVGDHLASAPARRGPPDLVVVDPPRSGLGAEVARRIGALGASRVALVSCDPATLARDARALAGAGYALGCAVPVDLFPQTAHVETVATMQREGLAG